MRFPLQFSLAIDTDLSTIDLMKIVKSNLHDLDLSPKYWHILDRNCIEIIANRDSDPILSLGETEGFLYYPICLEASPRDPNLTEEDQIYLARQMLDLLRSHKCKIVVCASFEDRVI
jgi:hypothetical protein